ncbi:MAG: Na/Pi cotransporter family protein [Lachnospiraceae bacterium]|nr:Na/Pi cotransporter family protein [Lachnospiraceae bacterium]
MGMYSLISIIGGLAFFLFGMNIMSSGLKKVAGDRLESVLQKMTDSPLKGLLFGAVITIAMQSSSALTVMLVGLVNSGIMSLLQTVGIIMGSNVGTTLTAWLLSLSGLKTDNPLLLLMKPEYFSPVIALIGVLLIMGAKQQKRKDLGFVLVGFAVLIHGMEWMSDALSPLAEMPEFTSILTAFKNPFLGVIIGTVFTGIIQSSAASVGVLQALSLTGHITYGVAIPIIMGQNIGTCVTALISSLGVSKNAKRVSVIHISFNLIGTAIGLIVYLFCEWVLQLQIFDAVITPFAIACFHSIFNVLTTIILLPFSKALVALAEHLIREDAKEEVFLDSRLLLSPAIAASECRKKTVLIMQKSSEGVHKAMGLLNAYDKMEKDNIHELEDEVDQMVEGCNQFLIQLSSVQSSGKESVMIADMLHVLGDMERISDYSLNLSSTVKKITQESADEITELSAYFAPINLELGEILDATVNAYERRDLTASRQIIEKTENLVKQIKKLKKSNLKSLRNGKVSAEASVYITDYLSVCRRIAEHSQNIAESLQ